MSRSERDPEPHGSEQVDDQFRALMEGLRTTIPGVMVLFSFLLILPLQASFGDVSDPNTIVYYAAFGSAALASILLIAPSVHQRVRAPMSGIRRNSLRHVMYAVKLATGDVGATLFTGSGDYEGLSYYRWSISFGQSWDTEGLIFPSIEDQ